MFSNITRKMAVAPAFFFFSTASLFAASTPATVDATPLSPMVTVITVTPERPAADEASAVFRQIQLDATRLSNDSETLASPSGSTLTRQSQAMYLNAIKERINETGENLAKLEEINTSTAPWQQEGYRQLASVGQKLAADTTAAINHLNDNPHYLYAPSYNDSLQAIANGASEMKDRVNQLVKIDTTNQKAQEFGQKAYELQNRANELQQRLSESNS